MSEQVSKQDQGHGQGQDQVLDLNTLDIGLDAEFSDESPFIGRIEYDQYEAGRYGPQWAYTVRPLAFALGGKTGMFHAWCALDSKSTRSKLGMTIAAFREVFGLKNPEGSVWKIGKRMFLGQVAWFVNREVSFGRDRITGEERKSRLLIPVKVATKEEVAQALAQAAAGGTTGGGNGVPTGTTTTSTAGTAAPIPLDPDLWTPEVIDQVLEIVAGKTPKEYQREIMKAGLSGAVKTQILNGQAVHGLMDLGLITVDGEKRITRPE